MQLALDTGVVPQKIEGLPNEPARARLRRKSLVGCRFIENSPDPWYCSRTARSVIVRE